jgi:hypothetical protein
MGKVLSGNDDKPKTADLSREFAQRIAGKLGGSCVNIGQKITKGKNIDLDAVE